MEKEDRISLVKYRMERAEETLREVEDLKRLGYYNTAVNRMYYACFYAAIALLVANRMEVKSHAGVRNSLSLHFIKTGILPRHYGQLYSLIFSKRTSGDYEDYFTNNLETVEQLLPQAAEFVATLRKLVEEWLVTESSK